MDSINNIKLLESKIKVLNIFLITLLYFLWAFKIYAGTQHSNYIDLQNFYNNIFSFHNDYQLNSTFYLKATILYDVLKFLKINLNNDIIGFSIHIFLCTLSLFYLYLILKNIFKIDNKAFIFVLIFMLIPVGGLLVHGNKGIIPNFTFNVTYFVVCIRIMFLYYLLREKSFHLVLISALMILLGLKAGYFLVGCGIVYSILFFKNKKKIYWILAPIVSSLFYININNVSLDFIEKIFVIETMILTDQEETALHLQPFYKLVMLIISFIAFPFLVKKCNSILFANFSKIVFLISLLTFVFGYVYFIYFYQFIPIIEIGLLSPSRSMDIYQITFFILLAYYIYQLKISLFSKSLIYSIIFFLNFGIFDNGYKGLIVSIVPITLLIVYLILKKRFQIIDQFLKNTQLVLLIFLILISPVILYLSYSKYNNNFNSFTFQKINKWTVPNKISKEKIELAINLRKCEDFILFDPSSDFFWPRSLAGKSRFIGHPIMNIYDVEFINETNYRKKIRDDFNYSLKKGELVSQKVIDQLSKYNLMLLIHKDYLNLIPDSIDKVNFKSFYLLNFLDEKSKKEFGQSCI